MHSPISGECECPLTYLFHLIPERDKATAHSLPQVCIHVIALILCIEHQCCWFTIAGWQFWTCKFCQSFFICAFLIRNTPLRPKTTKEPPSWKLIFLLTWMDGSDTENTNTLGITSKCMTLFNATFFTFSHRIMLLKSFLKTCRCCDILIRTMKDTGLKVSVQIILITTTHTMDSIRSNDVITL